MKTLELVHVAWEIGREEKLLCQHPWVFYHVPEWAIVTPLGMCWQEMVS